MAQRRWKIALYSHDTMGLGHMRRNLLVAESLGGGLEGASILMLFGAREAAAFPLPKGVEAMTLPALHKDDAGRYRARNLDLPLHRLVAIRAQTIGAALEAFEPDLLIVDKVARGAMRELEPALARLHRRGRTRLVLGLRDLLDEGTVVRAEFERDETVAAIDRYYDAVWVYGDPRICDPVSEYGLPDSVRAKLQFTGYLDPRHATPPRSTAPQPPRPEGRYALCMVGGGQDGADLAEAFARSPLPEDMQGVLVTGPMMPEERALALEQASPNGRLRVFRFLTDPSSLISGADRVVTMGGYNSVTDVLAYRKRTLVAPRVTPRTEQLLRAQRMARLGLLDVITPDELSSPRLGAWLASDIADPPPVRRVLDFDGAARLPLIARKLLRSVPQARRSLAGFEREVTRVAV